MFVFNVKLDANSYSIFIYFIYFFYRHHPSVQVQRVYLSLIADLGRAFEGSVDMLRDYTNLVPNSKQSNLPSVFVEFEKRYFSFNRACFPYYTSTCTSLTPCVAPTRVMLYLCLALRY